MFLAKYFGIDGLYLASTLSELKNPKEGDRVILAKKGEPTYLFTNEGWLLVGSRYDD